MRNEKNKAGFLLILIIFLAAVFRVTNLDLIEFKADEAINLFLATRPLFGHPFPPGGTVSSVGFLNPPLFNYLLLPAVFINTNPKVVSLLIALVNCLAIGGFFLFLKRAVSFRAALIACLLFALSPWAILFSRKIWTQSLLPPLMILWLTTLWQIVKGNRRSLWWLYIAVNLLIVQLHQASVIFLALANFFLLIQAKSSKIKLPIKQIFLGLLLGLIPAIPYLNYLIHNIFSRPEAILVAKQRFAQAFFPQIFLRPLQITSQGNFYFLLGSDSINFLSQSPLVYQLRKLFYLEYLLLPLGLWLFFKTIPRLRFLGYAIILLPPVYFLLHFEPFIHYYLIILPLLFLFLGLAVSHLISNQHTLIRLGGSGILIGLLLISIVYNTAFFRLIREQQGLSGDYGPAYFASEKEVKTMLLPFKHDPHYREMFLSSFLPRQYWHGNMPVPMMLYDFQSTQSQLPRLEERLKQVPVDSRVQNELIAYYSASPLAKEVIQDLKEKSQVIPGYKLVLDELSGLINSN